MFAMELIHILQCSNPSVLDDPVKGLHNYSGENVWQYMTRDAFCLTPKWYPPRLSPKVAE